GHTFPSFEILKTHIVDRKTNKLIQGIVGNNFSSYVRDYDFSVRLLDHNKGKTDFSVPENFGDLHGKLFQCFVNSDTYKENFKKLPVICLSVSDNKVYQRTENQHPILGLEYLPNESSLTAQYFRKMGFDVRYFLPKNAVAPLAVYCVGDLLNDYTNLELLSSVSTMVAVLEIDRPEVYGASAVAGACYLPHLNIQVDSLTRIVYDREERSRVAIQEGMVADENCIK